MKCLSLLLCLLWMSGAAYAAILPDGEYRITMAGSDMTLTTGGLFSGPQVIIKKKSSTTWVLRHRGNDIYEIWRGSKVLDSQECKVYNGVPAIVWPPNGFGNQHWKITRAGEHYRLTCVYTKLALELKDNRRENGNVLQGHTKTSSAGQLFDFIPLKVAQEKKPAFIGH